jgi:type I restriction enzyme S subunit
LGVFHLIERQLAKDSRATTQAAFGITRVRILPIPLPPLAEQQRIVAEVERRLSVVEELEVAIKANLARAGRLRQSILKRAFEGKLVPQDPADEPASVLLERIWVERAGRGVEGKRQPAAPQTQPRLPNL